MDTSRICYKFKGEVQICLIWEVVPRYDRIEENA